jgi:hypothetical protein
MKSCRFPSFRSRFSFCVTAFALWLYFVFCFAVHPASAIRDGRFIDPDNAMYLTETLEWLQGQGWYDRIEHRLDPPAGVPIHFSRLMELPYAAVILPLQSFLGSIGAATAAAAVIPPLFLLALFFVLHFQARFFMPRGCAWLAAFVALFAQNMAFVFMPGQAGHHSFIALLVVIATGCASMMLVRPKEWQWAVFAGVTLALALSIALESLPWVLLIAFVVGVFAVLRGGIMAMTANFFGAMLAMTGTVLLAAYKPPGMRHAMDLVAYSEVYVFLLFDMLMCFSVARIMRTRALKWRITMTSLAAVIGGGAFLTAYPELLTGPYGAADPSLLHLMLPNISEAIPMIKRVSVADLCLYFLPWPLLSLGVCIWQCARASIRRRRVWILFTVLQAAALALAAFYQARYSSYAQMFGIVPLAFLMQWGLRQTENRAVKLAWCALPALLVVLLPAVVYGDGLLSILLFPMQSYAPDCDVRPAADILSKPPYYTGAPRLILDTMDDGPELLLRTPHNILSAPYHTNIKGNLDVAAFFRTANIDEAEAFARRRGVDYVLLCRNIEAAYLTSDKDGTDYTSGYIRMPLPPPLAYRLITLHPPDWLRPVDVGTSDMVLFQVVPPRQP